MPSDLAPFDPLSPPGTPSPLQAEAVAPHRALPLLAGAVAAACFVSMDSSIKLMVPRYDAFQLSFFRFGAGSVFAVLLWLWHRSAMPRRAAWPVHIARSLFLLVSLVSYFHALASLPLAQAVTISYLAPILVSVLAIPILKERPAPAIWWALLLGAAGVAVSVVPELRASLGGTNTGRIAGMASAAVGALSFAFVMLLARSQSRTDSAWTILLVQNVLGAVLLAPLAAYTWKPVAASDLGLIALTGALGTGGLLSLTYAFRHLEASRVAPLDYTGFVWAALLGYALFGELPTLATAASAVLIIGGCLLLVRR